MASSDNRHLHIHFTMRIPTFEQLQRHVVYYRIAKYAPVPLVGAVLFTLHFSGCSEEITRDKLDEIVAPSKVLAPSMLYYKGRKGDFDYFVLNRSYLGSDKYHLHTADSPVKQPFPYSSDSSDWVTWKELTFRGRTRDAP